MKSLFKHKRFSIIVIASLVMLAIFLIDWMTKYHFYDDDNRYNIKPNAFNDYKVIGTRSLRHANTTFFSFLKIDIGWKWLFVIDIFLLIAFLIPLFITKHKIFAFSLGILLGGMFGNSFDLVKSDAHYVRDIFYLPWHDNGTFNLADVFIVCGSALTFIGIIFTQFNFKKSKKEKKNN